MDPNESSFLKKKECYQYSRPPEDPFDQYVGSVEMQATSSKLLTTYTQNEGSGVKNLILNSDAFDSNRSQELSSDIISSTFMGMF